MTKTLTFISFAYVCTYFTQLRLNGFGSHKNIDYGIARLTHRLLFIRVPFERSRGRKLVINKT